LRQFGNPFLAGLGEGSREYFFSFGDKLAGTPYPGKIAAAKVNFYLTFGT
jgi:hypothetical protein